MCEAIVCDLPTNPPTHRPTHPPTRRATHPPTHHRPVLLSIIEQHESDYLALEMRLQAALRRAEEAEGQLGKAEVMAAAAREAAGVEVVVTVGEEARPNVNASANVDRGAAAASAGRRQEPLGELAGDIAEVTGDDAEVTGDLDEMTRRAEQAPFCLPACSGGGTVSEPIGRHPVDRKRMSVQQNGKPAVTHFTVKERFAAFTYVNVKLETGRTHQIRVHFAHRRHALVGDQVYGGRLALPKGASDELIQVLRHFKRQALHATRLAFEHPISGEAIDLEVAPPKDFQALLETMRRDMSRE